MKEKIIITLTRSGDGWFGEMIGKTEKGSTDPIISKVVILPANKLIVFFESQVHKIEKRMENL